MINTDNYKSTYTTVADQTTWYPVTFQYDSPDNTPELSVTVNGDVQNYGDDYIVGVGGVQLTYEPDAGLELVIRRNVPLTQEIDFQIGIIDPEQIEHGFDRSVMRDQEIADYAVETNGRVEEIENTISSYGDVVTHNVSEFATAAQGAKADTAVQPGDNVSVLVNDANYVVASDLATVATSGSYNDLSDKPKYAASISLTIDPSTFVVTAQLKDQDNNNLGTAQTIDLPLESVVVSGAYDAATKEVVLTLEGGSTIRFSVADLVSGLQTEITSSNKLDADLVDDSNSAHKFVSTSEKTTWNGKQDTISDLATIRSGAAAGATAVQPGDLATVATSGDYDDLLNKPDALENKATGNDSLTICGTAATNIRSVNIGFGSVASGMESVSFGWMSDASARGAVAVGGGAKSYSTDSISIGNYASTNALNAIQLNASGVLVVNNDPNTVKVANTNGNFEIMSADGTIPEDRLADTTNAQQGDVLTLDANGDAVWQAGGGGLPSQTGQSGKFLTTDGTDASWATVNALQNESTGGGLWIKQPGTSASISGSARSIWTTYGSNSNKFHIAISGNYSTGTPGDSSIAVGGRASGSNSVAIGGWASGNGAIAIGWIVNNTTATGNNSIAIGSSTRATADYAIQIGTNPYLLNTNPDANTFKVANANGNFEIMSADGTVPTARLTKVNTTATLAVADWSSNTQTVSVTGMTADGVVLVSPTPANQSAYTSAGILCTAQAAGSLTFTCVTVPSADITVTVVML